MSKFIAKCPKCDGEFEAEAEWIGQEGECPSCGQTIPITCNAQTNASASSSPSNALSCAAQGEGSTKRMAKCPKCLREFDAEDRLEWDGLCPGCNRQTTMIIYEKRFSPDTPIQQKQKKEFHREKRGRSSYIPDNKAKDSDAANAGFYKRLAIGGIALVVIVAGLFMAISNAESQKQEQARIAAEEAQKQEQARIAAEEAKKQEQSRIAAEEGKKQVELLQLRIKQLNDAENLEQFFASVSDAEAATWKDLAEKGAPPAQFLYGACLVKGKHFPENYQKGIECYRKAAEQGQVDAQRLLGVIYLNGNESTPKDIGESKKWLLKAVEQGSGIVTQYELAEAYAASENFADAARWYRKCAEQGLPSAQWELFKCYLYGKGVDKDKDEAMKWLRKAAVGGNENAKEILRGFISNLK